ncbi:MAG: hypothetical protein JNL82_04895 [Myxococcales bacterium]|nr:hypothetical protein [Myxococcales bacterium]
MTARLAALACLAASSLAPTLARADDLVRATSYETPPRKGFYAEMALRPGGVAVRDGLVPAMRTHLTIGGGLTDRFKLGMQLSISGYMNGVKKPAVGFDTVATAYVWRGLYLRAGAGLISAVPLHAGGADARPAYGGSAGLGYEWTLKKGAGLGLGGDLDLRATTDRHVARGLFVGLHFAFH